MTKKIFLFLILSVFFLFVMLLGFKMLSRPSTEYDEGVYLTSFLLVDKGNTLYQETFFSQPPGFFYLIYPGFELFGKTLEAGRLTVFIWSVIGLLAILWLTYEMRINILVGIFAIAVLWGIPLYFNEILTFHSDSLPLSLSALSLASMLRFKNKDRIIWFVLAVLFFGLGILVKMEVSIALSLLLIFIYILREKKSILKKIFLCLFLALLILSALFYVSVLPFGGPRPFYINVFSIRFQAFESETFSLMTLFTYLINLKTLLIIFVTTLLLSAYKLFKIKNKENNLPFFILGLWLIVRIFLLIIYYPLFIHHLVSLTVPLVLLFSYLLIYYPPKNMLMNLFRIMIFLFIAFNLFTTIKILFAEYPNYHESLSIENAEIINKNTSPNDYIISDDSLLYGLTGRLPPPWLSDLSQVRLASGNLSADEFERQLSIYKPKLIFILSGRLNAIRGLDKILSSNYKVFKTFDSNRKIFILN